ncbi:hypothetical protein BH11PSE9_BH11PSE9_22150 [soil metagenome]
MTTENLKSWSEYRSEIREFDAILEYAKAVSNALIGKTSPSPSASYAEQIFVKALSHCIVVRQLAPDPSRKRPSELWDVPSISAVARCVIDAHDAFFYIGALGCTAEEAAFRQLLWEAHDKTRRARMLRAIGSSDSRNPKLFAEENELLAKLMKHPLFATIRKELQKSVARGDPPAYHLSQKEICAAASVDHDYYIAVTMQLSQHVHTYPFSVRQLFAFRAGALESLRLMALPVQYTIPFLTRMTEGMRDHFPGFIPEPPSRTARAMAVWREISTAGIKNMSMSTHI